MRTIHLANAERLDAEVGFEPVRSRRTVRKAAPDGAAFESGRILDETADTTIEALRKETPDAVALGRRIAEGDPEVDLELAGRRLEGLHKVYVTDAGEVAFDVALKERVVAPDGTVKEERDPVETSANVALEKLPVRWTGKLFPKKAAIRRFAFGRCLALRHVNGLTYKFLREMAETLASKKTMMLVGAGEKGAGPLVLNRNGTPYRGFLEGRVDGDKYLLLLHLTNLELKELPNG